jgi:hypothetical protein
MWYMRQQTPASSHIKTKFFYPVPAIFPLTEFYFFPMSI